MSGKRNITVDICKGICILLVIFGHYSTNMAGAVASQTLAFVPLVHLPLFFFISGYYMKDGEKLSVVIGKGAKRLLLPYFAIHGAHLIYGIVTALIGGRAISEEISNELRSILKYDNTVAWFLMAMFWGRIFCSLCSRLVIYRKNGKCVDLGMFTAVALSFVAYAAKPGLGRSLSPLSIGLGLAVTGWMYAGRVIRKCRIPERFAKTGWIAPAVAFVALAVTAAAAGIECDIHTYSLRIQSLSAVTGSRFALSAISAILVPTASLLVCMLVYCIAKRISAARWQLPARWLAFVGKHTMTFLVLHSLEFIWSPSVIGAWIVVPQNSMAGVPAALIGVAVMAAICSGVALAEDMLKKRREKYGQQ